VEMGCWAERHADLCCWRRYCSTMVLRRLLTALSSAVVTAPGAAFLAGGLARASLTADLKVWRDERSAGNGHVLRGWQCHAVVLTYAL